MPRQIQLFEIGAHSLRRNPLLAQVGHRRDAVVPLRELLPVGTEHEPVMDVLGWLGPERFVAAPAVQGLVRAVVVAADHVRDPEVDVVDDAREVVRRPPVLTDERDPVEALAQSLRGLEIAIDAVALPGRSVVPDDAEPFEIGDELLLPALHVPGGDRCRRSGAASSRRAGGSPRRRAHYRGGASPSDWARSARESS